MIKATTPVLEIKTPEIDFPSVQTVNITISKGDLTIVKGNDDIEIDGKIIIVKLTKEEAGIFKNNNISTTISVVFINKNGEKNNAKVAWAKIGSQTESGSENEEIRPEELENYYTKEEIKLKLNEYYTKSEIDSIITGSGGGKFDIYEWVIASNDKWESSGELKWTSYNTSSGSATISLVISVLNDVMTQIFFNTIQGNTQCNVYLNGEEIRSGAPDYSIAPTYNLKLKAGVNNLAISADCGRTRYATFNIVNIGA